MRNILRIFIYSFCLRYFLKLIIGVKFADASFLRQEKQFILIANHNSHLDTLSLLAALPSSSLHLVKPVAAKDHFGKTKMQERLSNFFINTLLIERKITRDNLHNGPLEKMNQAIKDGFSLIIFPEGTRGTPEVQQPMKPGVAHVLLDNPGLKYVPVYLQGMGKAMPRGDNLIIPHCSSLDFGSPKSIQSTDIKEILSQIQADMNELKNTITA